MQYNLVPDVQLDLNFLKLCYDFQYIDVETFLLK